MKRNENPDAYIKLQNGGEPSMSSIPKITEQVTNAEPSQKPLEQTNSSDYVPTLHDATLVNATRLMTHVKEVERRKSLLPKDK